MHLRDGPPQFLPNSYHCSRECCSCHNGMAITTNGTLNTTSNGVVNDSGKPRPSQLDVRTEYSAQALSLFSSFYRPADLYSTLLRSPGQFHLSNLLSSERYVPLALLLDHPLTTEQTKTDHMLIAHYDPVNGWSAPEIKPYGPLSIDPASSCLQYCPNTFEGMKVRFQQ